MTESKPDLSPGLLLVEDDPTSAEWLRTLCSGWGYNVETAASCAQALAAPAGFDALLLDQQLPDGSGEQLLADLRQAGHLCPALALSADMGEHAQVRLKAAGFADCLRKPFSALALLRALDAAGAAPPRWDSARAMAAAGGRESVMHSLRQLLAQDLPLQRAALIKAFDQAPSDHSGVDAVLHRMLGSARLTGAASLAAAIDCLRSALALPETDPSALDQSQKRLLDALDDTLLDCSSQTGAN